MLVYTAGTRLHILHVLLLGLLLLCVGCEERPSLLVPPRRGPRPSHVCPIVCPRRTSPELPSRLQNLSLANAEMPKQPCERSHFVDFVPFKQKLMTVLTRVISKCVVLRCFSLWRENGAANLQEFIHQRFSLCGASQTHMNNVFPLVGDTSFTQLRMCSHL